MPRYTDLWRHTDFLKLWAAQTIAALSAYVTHLALPLIAALTLHASPFEMGLLNTMAALPNLVIGLFAGLWVDRLRRRQLMIASDVARALLLVTIPLTSAFNLLSIWQLYAVLFLFGIGTTLFDVANVSYLPSLVGRERLLTANSRLVASTSVAGAVGPGLAGTLLHLLSAPIAVLVDAVSLIVSATLVHTIRGPEPEPVRNAGTHRIWRDIFEGLRPLYRDPLLRSVVGSSMIYLFFSSIMLSVYVLYATRDLAIPPAVLGVIYGLGGVGAAIGAVLARRVTERVGFGLTLIAANLVGGLFLLLIPLAGSLPTSAALLLAVAQGASQAMGAIFAINQTSLRQALTPEQVLGRMNASYRFLTVGTIPLGSLLGGALATVIGVRETLLVGVIGGLLSVVWLLCSPARTLTGQAMLEREGGAGVYPITSTPHEREVVTGSLVSISSCAVKEGRHEPCSGER
jgi:MFS family permease